LKNLARKEKEANGNDKAQAKPFSKRTFRKEINAMARKAGKNDGLAVIAAALKREQSKQSNRSSKKHARAAAKKKAEASDSDSDSDESVHILESPIPRKSSLKTIQGAKAHPKKKILFELMDEDSSDEDMPMVTKAKKPKTNQPSAEEIAFLKMVEETEANAEENAFFETIEEKND
jgi:hypothetical protein